MTGTPTMRRVPSDAPKSPPDPGMVARREDARLSALEIRAEFEGLLALGLEEAKVARGIAYKAEAERQVAMKAVRRKLAKALKNARLDLSAAMKDAEELQMMDDQLYKLAAERQVGTSHVATDNMLLDMWMFVNQPATERRVLRYFRMRWNASNVLFFLERDETGKTEIPVWKRGAGGRKFAQCYLMPFGEKGTTAGGNSRGGWEATQGPECEGVESGVEGGEDWEQGVLRILDTDGKVWDLTSVRPHSAAWMSRAQELEMHTLRPAAKLSTLKEWIEFSIDSFKDDEVEAERQRQIELGCHAGPPIARMMAYSGPNPQNWNKSSLDELRDDIVADKSLKRLFLEHNTLSVFPTNMLNMTSLSELWLGHNMIETVDDQVVKKFARRTPLTFLSLDCNYLEDIPQSMGDLSVLQELRISANGLKLIPPQSLACLDLLVTLWLQNNRLVLLPEDMGTHMHNLQSLFLNNNELSRLPHSVAGWTSLTELRVHENRLDHLPTDMCALRSIRVLKASMNRIQVLPAHLDGLTTLRELELGYNEITRLSLPDGGLLRLSALEKLHLENNLVLEIPMDDTDEDSAIARSGSQLEMERSQGIVGLSSLTELRLDCNKLLIVPPDVGRLTSLKTLLLAFNRIQWLPVELGELRDLHCLTLHENPIMQIRPELTKYTDDARSFIAYFREEKEQNLRNSRLSAVPEHVASKLQLQALYLSYNDISRLPPTLHVLHELRTLHVDHNNLFLIEPWIGELVSLTDLALEDNRLLSLPSTLGLLSRLQMLTLQSNSISSLPSEIGLCRKLHTLNIDHNPLRPPYSDALEEGGGEGVLELLFEQGSSCKLPTRPNTSQTMRFSR